jgi:hypothetical protein
VGTGAHTDHFIFLPEVACFLFLFAAQIKKGESRGYKNITLA